MSTGAANLEIGLFQRAQAGDPQATAALVDRYLPLARSLALRFRGRSEPVDDLVQVASVGLVIAISRFDCARGLAFSTYAVPTILGELRRHFRDRTWSVRVPRRLQERAAALTKATDELSRTLGRLPTVAELSGSTGLSEEDVVDALQAGAAYRSASLDRPVSAEEPETLGEFLGYADPGYEAAEARALLDSAARGLTARQRRVIRMHLEEDLTQDQIAAAVGISQMQVSRDLRQAREVLQAALVA